MQQQIGELVIRRNSPNDTDGQSVGGALSQVTHDEIQLDTYLKDRRSERGWSLSYKSPNDEIHHSLSFSIILNHHR